MMLYALVEGVIAPRLTAAVAGIRTGSFDYILLRLVDPLSLCSLANIRVWKIFDFMLGLGVAGYGWRHLAVPPAWGDIILAMMLALGGLTTAYALFVLAFSASFALISVKNITNILTALLGFSRWPIHLFELPWRFVFRFIFPIAVMTSYPVMALMGQWNGPMALGALGVALIFLSRPDECVHGHYAGTVLPQVKSVAGVTLSLTISGSNAAAPRFFTTAPIGTLCRRRKKDKLIWRPAAGDIP